jgi:integrase
MKTYTLYKRGNDGKNLAADAPGYTERPWYFSFSFRGTKYPRCTETNVAADAQKEARRLYNEIVDGVKAGESIEHTKTRHAPPPVAATVGELFTAYRASPVHAVKDTRDLNVRALRRILERVHAMDTETVLATPFPTLINGAAAEKWFTLSLPGVTPVSMNSLWRQAKSVCTAKAAVFTFKEKKIWNECLLDFETTGLVCQKKVSKAAARPPADDVIADTIAAWETCENRNIFLAIGLELAFGLRAGEVTQARTTWLQTKYGTPMLCATGKFKHNLEGYFEVPALDPFYSILMTRSLERDWMQPKENGKPASDELLITGSATYLNDGLQRDVSAFLRGHGWTTKKTNHALRAYAGGQVCLKYGVYKAQQFLRHSSVKVTEQHYLYLMKHPLVDKIRDACPARWATLDTATVEHADKITANPWLEAAARH